MKTTDFDLVPWIVFEVEQAGGKLKLTEVAQVEAYGEDDAIISACEKRGKGGEFYAAPSSEIGRTVVLRHHASIVP